MAWTAGDPTLKMAGFTAVTVETIRARIARGRELAVELEQRADAWCAGLELRLQHEMMPDGGHSWRMLPPPEAPLDLAIRLGEIAHNLRSALDHIVYGISQNHGGNKRTQFPIVDDEAKWAGAVKSMLGGLPDDVVEKIRAVQPFNFGPNVGRLGLVLSELSNYDKHRDLTAIVGVVHTLDVRVRLPGGGESMFIQPLKNTNDAGVLTAELPWVFRLRITHRADFNTVDIFSRPEIFVDSVEHIVQFAFERDHNIALAIGVPAALADWTDKVLDDLVEYL